MIRARPPAARSARVRNQLHRLLTISAYRAAPNRLARGSAGGASSAFGLPPGRLCYILVLFRLIIATLPRLHAYLDRAVLLTLHTARRLPAVADRLPNSPPTIRPRLGACDRPSPPLISCSAGAPAASHEPTPRWARLEKQADLLDIALHGQHRRRKAGIALAGQVAASSSTITASVLLPPSTDRFTMLRSAPRRAARAVSGAFWRAVVARPADQYRSSLRALRSLRAPFLAQRRWRLQPPPSRASTRPPSPPPPRTWVRSPSPSFPHPSAPAQRTSRAQSTPSSRRLTCSPLALARARATRLVRCGECVVAWDVGV